jgi:S1-C subfamily serine protease
MKRTPIYSRSAQRQRSPSVSSDTSGSIAGAASDPPSPTNSDTPEVQTRLRPKRLPRVRAFVSRHERAMLALSSALLTALALIAYSSFTSIPAQHLTQKDIDAAVMHTLKTNTLPSPEARAFEKIRPSVVRVVQEDDHGGRGALKGVGSGVVLVDNGTILTSLHVVEGGEKHLRVRFANGFESRAVVLVRQPENDLAVIRAMTVPDDLVPATLRSTRGLATGDKVVAVGFPFNIGPSASSGIVSGLKRIYGSEEDGKVLKNLIQFDAAANPGNSGGPLITMDGEVVGIVTAILSPHEQGTFIGIGFAVPIETAANAAGEPPF